MTNLVGTAGWDAIPQIETADQLVGGPGGKLNQQAQALLNYASALRQGRVITPIDPGVGCVGDGIADDWAALQGMINTLKRPGLDLSTSASSKAALRGLPRVKVDLLGKTYMVSQSLDFADTYNLMLCNGTIMAHPAWVGGSGALLNIAAPQSSDVYRDQHIRYVTFSDITVDGNGLANCIYLENTFNLVLNRVYGLGWPDGGNGLWTSVGGVSPATKNTNLQINACVFMQKDSAEFVGGGVTTSGTAVSLKNADFIINGLVVAFSYIGLEIDNQTNAQISNLHSYSAICLSIGPNSENLTFSNIYMDTGLVQLRSFSHTFAAADFVAGSTVQLIATQPNQDIGGLSMEGRFGNPPQFLTEGSGTWASSFNGRISGMSKTGVRQPTRGGIALGAQSASNPSLVFSTDSQVYSKTGFFSPAANSLGYSITGTESWRVDDSGRFLLGYTSSVQVASGTTPRFQMDGLTSNNASFSATRWNSTAGSFGGRFIVARSKSDVVGTYSAVQAGDVLGRYDFAGDSGSSLNSIGAYIKATANNNWTASAASTNLTFATTQNGQTSPTDWWTIGQNGTFYPVNDGVQSLGTPTNRIGKINAVEASFDGPVKLASYTVATLPSAPTYAGCMIYVSNGTSNKRLAVSDGTNWRWPDGSIVS